MNKKEKPCPNCGHCPTCGRSNQQLSPSYPPYWPYWTDPYRPWWGVGYGQWQVQPTTFTYMTVTSDGIGTLSSGTITSGLNT